MSARSPSKQSKAARLRRAARALAPTRAPFYVQHATEDCPLTGWWWQPAGSPQPVPLAQNYDTAIVRLDRLAPKKAAA